MAFFDSYKNINRGGITKDSKTATKDALEWACQNPDCRPHAMKIVKALLDFKALQSNDTSAERSLGDLGYHVRRCNQANGLGVQELTERSLHELVRNRSAIFKKELPATFKELVKKLLGQPGSHVLIDKNTARILRSNGLITEADARNAPDSSVAVRIDPRELAQFLTQSERSWGAEQREYSCWSLSQFMKICMQDLSRPGSSEMERRALAHLTVQVSKGLLGAQKFHEVQRQASEAEEFRRGVRNFANNLRETIPARANEVSPYTAAQLEKGGQGINYIEFLTQARAHRDKYKDYPGFKEAMESLDVRERSLARAPRISQHLTADAARNSPQYQVRPTIMNPYPHQPLSTPQHQQRLDMMEAVAAGNRQTRWADAEEGKTNRALLVCGARTQTVIAMLDSNRKLQRGGYEFNEAEQDLLDRVAACVAPYAGEAPPEAFAEGTLCRTGDGLQVTTTAVETSTKIVYQTLVKEIHIPGCQPFERFYLVQERKIRFHWDAKVNFIKADLIYHSAWEGSTTAPNPTEVIF